MNPTPLYKNLTFQVLVAIALGIAVGLLFSGFAPIAKTISETFINLIKMVIAPIIFLTIVIGIAGMGDMKKVGRVGGKALLYFEVVTTFALFIGLVMSHLIKPGVGVVFKSGDMSKVEQYEKSAESINWLEFFTHIVPDNVIAAFAKGDILQVLFFAVLFGVALTKLGPKMSEPTLATFERLSKTFFGILKIVMRIAPIGAFGGMASALGTFGASALLPLAKVMASVYGTMALFIFVVLNLIAYFAGFSLWKLLGFIKEEILIVLGTSSSESAMPGVMLKLEKLGCSRSVVGLVVPTGYSFNLDGTTIYLVMAVIFLAQVFKVDLTLGEQLTVIGILMLTSKGAAAVTGGGFIVLASTLTALKIIPVEGLGMLIGIDRFMSEARAITNLIGNSVATMVIAKSEKEFDEEKYQLAIQKK